MPIMTFLVLDVSLTSPVALACDVVYRSNPKILEEYIRNILHIHIH